MADVHPRAHVAAGDGQGQDDYQYLVRLALWLAAISVLWIIFVIVAPIAPWFPAATRQAGEVDVLFKFMLATGGAIIIAVQGLLISIVLRFRRQKNEPATMLGVQTHGNTRLELAWTAAPALLLVVLVALSMAVWTDEHATRKNALQLGVNGFQYGWNFDLPQYGVTAVDPVELPVNRPVYVSERSTGNNPYPVIHSFWVPEFRIKQDVVPGIVTHEEFTPTRIGAYRVICTEFCGPGHSGMYTTLSVVSEADFATWVVKPTSRGGGGGKLPAGGATAALIQQQR